MRIKESKSRQDEKRDKTTERKREKIRDYSIATGENPENRCFPERQHTLMSSIVIGPFRFSTSWVHIGNLKFLGAFFFAFSFLSVFTVVEDNPVSSVARPD